ncbi:MAG: hypothetical protein ACYTXA_19305 [Nostoc sp.]
MIHPNNSDKTQLDALISQGMSRRQTDNRAEKVCLRPLGRYSQYC